MMVGGGDDGGSSEGRWEIGGIVAEVLERLRVEW